MKMRLSEKLKQNNSKAINDIDLHDFLELAQRGMNDTEIAQELGINQRYIAKIREDMQRDY
jgi:predicted DNA-binding transcriptional regulator